jgi:hypothetical protein
MKQVLSLIVIVFSIWLVTLTLDAYPDSAWPAIPCVIGFFTTIYFCVNAIKEDE